jgi:hypothetical protein
MGKKNKNNGNNKDNKNKNKNNGNNKNNKNKNKNNISNQMLQKYNKIIKEIWKDMKLESIYPKMKIPMVLEMKKKKQMDTFLGFAEIETINEEIKKLSTEDTKFYPIKPKSISLCLKDTKTNEFITEDKIFITFLHEIAHLITPTIHVFDKSTKEWIKDDHTIHFYKNFSKLARYLKYISNNQRFFE